MKFLKGQVWIETVLYSLIAFALIGMILAFAKPKIEEYQDKGVIEQSIKVLEEIDYTINNIGTPGNQRTIIIKIGKGNLDINGKNDTLLFNIESRYAYSEYGQKINVGGIGALTEKKGRINKVTLSKNYSANYNITYKNRDETGRLGRSATPYKILISNKGESSDRTNINIEIIN